jgi:hypothetical protein
MTKIEKAEKLLRYHRKHVFNESNGDLHEMAILRIKSTRIWADYMASRKEEADYRKSERLLRMWA